jgi:hypothetical protein
MQPPSFPVWKLLVVTESAGLARQVNGPAPGEGASRSAETLRQFTGEPEDEKPDQWHLMSLNRE